MTNRLYIVETNKGRYAVRPMSWCAVCDYNGKIEDGLNHTAIFNSQEEAQEYIELVNEKNQRENPQPLTLEQLKQRVGEPIYTITFGNTCEWEILCSVNQEYIRCCSVNGGGMYDSDTNCYDVTWFAYDHEPKGVCE